MGTCESKNNMEKFKDIKIHITLETWLKPSHGLFNRKSPLIEKIWSDYYVTESIVFLGDF